MAARCAGAIARAALVAAAVMMLGAPTTKGQPSDTIATPSSLPPEPIYWRQNLISVTYHGSFGPGGAIAEAVWLYLSTDRGASWQKLSEARPDVRAFNYHAEADGEYWFAIRATDGRGGFWPAGPLAPELRFVVDTTAPRFDGLSALMGNDGSLEINWQLTDANWNIGALRVEVQTDASDAWQPVALPPPTVVEPGRTGGRATTTCPTPGRVVRVRAVALDLAGNQAEAQADVQSGAGNAATVDPTIGGLAGWTASTSASTSAEPAPATDQPWSARANGATNRFVSFGGAEVPHGASAYPRIKDGPPFAPLEPFRQRTASPAAEGRDDSSPVAPPTSGVEGENARGPTEADGDPWLWLSGPDVSLPAGAVPRLVSSPTFLLEYELEAVGPWGVAKVELWGTRDGGRTWRSYASDQDHASPMQVTVGDAGLYGFRIVVAGGGGAGGFPPQPGDRPELWIGVDLRRPEIELTAAEPAGGDLAGQLLLRWWADDDNLQQRPIGIFYSSRPAGPWTAVATNLENTGEYPWRLERHLPPRVYLRLEARDTAGNRAAYQTYEPVSIELPPPTGRLESVETLDDPTAWSLGDVLR